MQWRCSGVALASVAVACGATGGDVESGGIADGPDGGVHVQPDATADGGAEAGGWQMPLPRSGSRVHVRGTFVDGEIASIAGSWDEERGTWCEPGVAEDGTTRCLPSGGGADVVFTDPDCTQPMLRDFTDPCSVPSYAVQDVAGCPRSERVFARGAALQPDAYYFRVGTACVLNDHPSTSGDGFFAALPSPPGDWLRLERSVRHATPDLGVVTWTGEDGSVIVAGLTLLPGDDACEISTDLPRDGTVGRCVPVAKAQVARDVHTDAACTDELWQSGRCEPARIAPVPAPRTCDPSYQRLRRFVRLPADTSYTWPGWDGVCQTFAPELMDATREYGTLGDWVPLEEFPPIAFEPPRVPGAASVLASNGVPLQIRGGTGCRATRFADGNLYCTEGTWADMGLFADDACTQPIGVLPTYTGCPSEGSTAAWLLERGPPADTCAADVRSSVRPILASYDGPMYRIDGGTCLRTAGAVGPFDFYYFAVGAPVAPDGVLPRATEGEL